MILRYYGFVYLWFDAIRRKFCIGSHYGSLDDGYVTSTGHMMRAYKKRPETFRRKILDFCFEQDPQALQKIEQKWLNFIKDEELGTKYYNLKKLATGGNGSANKGNQKCGGWNRGISTEMLGLRRDGMFCLLIDKPKERKKPEWSDERREKIAENMRHRWKDGKMTTWNKGKSKESDSRLAEYGKKVSESKRGTEPWNKGKKCEYSSNNGRKGAEKQSQAVKGRKKFQKTDGSSTWKYPDGNGGWYTKENGEQVPVL